MPSRIAAPVVTIDAGKMHKIDTRNIENLHGMWTGACCRSYICCHVDMLTPEKVFSKCAESMEDGRRLENLSWRIWNRETFCCDSQPQFPSSPSSEATRLRPKKRDIPELSSSVESVQSNGADLMQCPSRMRTLPLDIKRPSRLSDSIDQSLSNRKEKHLTSLKLEEMVVSIKERKRIEPLPASIVDAVPSRVPDLEVEEVKTSPADTTSGHSAKSSPSTDLSSSTNSKCANSQYTNGSDTSAELLTSHSVVRGFSPGNISSSSRSRTHLAPTPILKKPQSSAKPEEHKKGIFFIAGSSGDDESSFEEKMQHKPVQPTSTTSPIRSTSERKTTFKDEVESRSSNYRSHQDENVFESDDEDDDVSESAIEDEDDSDWEDSSSESGEPINEDKGLFQRVPSRPELTSRTSLLTTLIHQPDRAAALAQMATKSSPALHRSRTSSRNGPSVACSPQEESILSTQYKASSAKPIIMTTSNVHPPALSPRTTRRNMLSTELTESLRKHLLWERQQKSTTANAVLKRRHTAHDMANLKNFPKPTESGTTSKNNSWNNCFDHGLGEYHERGW